MALILWTTFALVVWIVLWSIGAKAFDAWMLMITIVLIGATIEIVKKYLPNRRG
jgi:hypothetical protein